MERIDHGPGQHEQSNTEPGNMHFPAAHFDVREYARSAAGSHRDELGLDEYIASPLSQETLRTLAYLRNVERATMSHLRGVLVTATHKDARITAFLVTWAFEKFWIADALDGIITTHEENGAEPAPAALTIAPAEHTIREAVYANIVGVPLIASHMALGAVDEWLTQAAYRRILELENHPQLAVTIATFLRIKERQLDFFEAQARFRLTESRKARKIARRRLSSTAWPIGALAEPANETRHFYSRLFTPVPELIAELDARVDSLPGVSGLDLIRKAARS